MLITTSQGALSELYRCFLKSTNHIVGWPVNRFYIACHSQFTARYGLAEYFFIPCSLRVSIIVDQHEEAVVRRNRF